MLKMVKKKEQQVQQKLNCNQRQELLSKTDVTVAVQEMRKRRQYTKDWKKIKKLNSISAFSLNLYSLM